MEFLTGIFSHVCSQGRSFVVDGAALPVCQRCLGLYVGAALTAVWLVLSGTWRRGLPTLGVLLLHVGPIVIAGMGGTHVIDAGATWRLMCGLWSGHMIMWWMIGGCVRLWRGRTERRGRRRRDRLLVVQALLVLLVLAGLSVLFDLLSAVGWYFWTGAAVLGAACLAASAVAGLLGLALSAVRSLAGAATKSGIASI